MGLAGHNRHLVRPGPLLATSMPTPLDPPLNLFYLLDVATKVIGQRLHDTIMVAFKI